VFISEDKNINIPFHVVEHVIFDTVAIQTTSLSLSFLIWLV